MRILHSLAVLSLAVLPTWAQGEDTPRALPAPGEAVTPGKVDEASMLDLDALNHGLRVDPGAFLNTRIEGWDVVMEREKQRPLFEQPSRRFRNGKRGEWESPDGDGALPTRSGDKSITNYWGDMRMPIGFEGKVDLVGVWLGKGTGQGSEADAVRLIAQVAGKTVATGSWTELEEEMVFVSLDAKGIDRVLIEARKTDWSQAWYSLDDLTYVRDGRTVVLDFEDVSPGNLTATGYAGLDWQQGEALKSHAPGPVSLLMRPQPQPIAPLAAPAPTPLAPAAPTAPSVGVIDGPDVLQQFFCQELGGNPGASSIPPDTHGAVGPNHFVTVVNSNITYYSKTGNQIAGASLNSFFGATAGGDPRVVYDPQDERWIVLSTNFSNRIYIAVSLTDSPQGGWLKTSFNTSQGADSNRWPDYPTLGVGARGIYMSCLMIDNATGGGTMTIWALDKAPMIATVPALGTVTAFRNLPYTQANQPAVHWDDPGVAYIASTWNNNQIIVRKVNPPLTAPTLQTASIVTVASHNAPADAPTSGSSVPISTGDDRLQNAVYRGTSLFTCHTIGTNQGSAGVRWYEIGPTNGADIQRSTIRDETGTFAYYYPSIAVNSVGDVVVGYSGSSAATFVSCFVSGRKVNDTQSDISDPFEYKAGTGSYQQLDGSGRNRWGDYSGTTCDPDDDTFWTVQTFARSGNLWRLRAAQVEYTGSLISNYCVTSPNSVGPGAFISASGTTSFGANDLTLLATGMPTGQFMLFFYSFGQGNAPVANGTLCVAAPLFRLGATQISGLGDSNWSFDVTSPPQVSGQISVGDTVYFQGWYRDPAAGGANSNFTNGLQTTWIP